MSQNSKIEWTDHTFNSWEGCQKVGPGCDHCYAETRNARFAGGTPINWGPGAPRRRTSAANWRKPLQWNAQHDEFFAKHGRRQRVFCASLADVFDNEVDPLWRRDLFELIERTPDLDWLLLTKRIGNVSDMSLTRDRATGSRVATTSGSARQSSLRPRPIATSRSCLRCQRGCASSPWSRCWAR
ncbi:protein gp37 [Paraburkholderia youngii]